MSTGKRPGGLTALAVISFVWGALKGLGLLGLAVMIGMPDVMERALKESGDANQEEALALIRLLSEWPLRYLFLGLSAAMALALILSGFGYLKQRRFLGRTMGNVYAILAIVVTGLWTQVQPFGFASLTELVYPVLTLALVNTIFRDDLVN